MACGRGPVDCGARAGVDRCGRGIRARVRAALRRAWRAPGHGARCRDAGPEARGRAPGQRDRTAQGVARGRLGAGAAVSRRTAPRLRRGGVLEHLLPALAKHHILFNLFNYITFRAAGATVTALVLAFVLGPGIIRALRDRHVGQVIRAEGPASHAGKRGTPTMGGLIILLATVVPTLLWARLDTRYAIVAVAAMLWMGTIGFLDDYLKIVRGKSQGLVARWKLVGQISFGLALAVYLLWSPLAPNLEPTSTQLPVFKYQLIVFWPVTYVLFVTLVVTGSSNAVNLTDGLDGLATGLTAIAAGAFAIFAYVFGRFDWTKYVGVYFLPGAGELTVFCGALAGASLGFLWFNAHPAQVFMGDPGGVAATKLLAREGAHVYASDASDHPYGGAAAVELRELAGVEVDVGRHDLAKIRSAAGVVVSPGVPPDAAPLAAAREAGVPVVSAIDLGFRALAGSGTRCIAITGTNGKTTTTALVAHLLRAAGLAAEAAGNIGRRLTDIAVTGDRYQWLAVEVSSFQLHDSPHFAPEIGILTNLAPDHLDRYASVDAYYHDKQLLFSNARARDVWVLNGDDPAALELPGSAPGRRVLFSLRRPAGGWYDAAARRLRLGEGELRPRDELRLLGDHNVANALAAALRSEEHTSELQSRGHLVCRLLLEKKKPKSVAVLTRPTTIASWSGPMHTRGRASKRLSSAHASTSQTTRSGTLRSRLQR